MSCFPKRRHATSPAPTNPGVLTATTKPTRRHIRLTIEALFRKAQRVAARTLPFPSSPATSSVSSAACSTAVMPNQTAETSNMPTAPAGVSKNNTTSISVSVPRSVTQRRTFNKPTTNGTKTTIASSLKSRSATNRCRHACRNPFTAADRISSTSSRNINGH